MATRIDKQINLLSSSPGAPRWAKIMLVVLVGACGALVWALVNNSSGHLQTADVLDATTPSQTSDQHLAADPAQVAVVPVPVSAGSAVSAAVGDGSDTVRYYETTGRLFQADMRSGKVQTLSDQRLSGFLKSWWTPDGSAVVSEFQGAHGTSYRFYDLQSKRVATIGSGIEALAIAPDSKHVAYVAPASDGLEVFTADIDGSNPHSILLTRTEVVDLTWPSTNQIVLISKRADQQGRDMSTITPDGALSILMENRQNLDYVWTRDGQKLLYSYFAADGGLQMLVRDMASGTEETIGLNTSARKCAWHDDDTTITCGVPANNTLSSSVSAGNTASTDDVVSYDINTGLTTTHWQAKTNSPFGVLDPILSSSGFYFVFSNLFNQRLYSLRLSF